MSQAEEPTVNLEEVRAALDFDGSVRSEPNPGRRVLGCLALSLLVGGCYFALWEYGENLKPAVVVTVFAALLLGAAVLGPVLFRRLEVRESYRQDPFHQPKPDARYSLCLAVIVLLPTLLRPLTWLGTWGGAIAAVALAAACFWVLYTRAWDLRGRQAKGHRRD